MLHFHREHHHLPSQVCHRCHHHHLRHCRDSRHHPGQSLGMMSNSKPLADNHPQHRLQHRCHRLHRLNMVCKMHCYWCDTSSSHSKPHCMILLLYVRTRIKRCTWLQIRPSKESAIYPRPQPSRGVFGRISKPSMSTRILDIDYRKIVFIHPKNRI